MLDLVLALRRPGGYAPREGARWTWWPTRKSAAGQRAAGDLAGLAEIGERERAEVVGVSGVGQMI